MPLLVMIKFDKLQYCTSISKMALASPNTLISILVDKNQN